MWERAAGGGIVLAGAVYLALSLRLPRGTVEQPGPGFFPLFISVLLLSAALGFACVAVRRGRRPPSAMASSARRRVIAVLAALVGFCLLLPVTGYPIAALLFVGIMLQQLGASWFAVITIALGSAGISYYLFAIVLRLPLPIGMLGRGLNLN